MVFNSRFIDWKIDRKNVEWVFRVNKDELRLLIKGVDVYVQTSHDFVDEVAVDIEACLNDFCLLSSVRLDVVYVNAWLQVTILFLHSNYLNLVNGLFIHS